MSVRTTRGLGLTLAAFGIRLTNAYNIPIIARAANNIPYGYKEFVKQLDPVHVSNQLHFDPMRLIPIFIALWLGIWFGAYLPYIDRHITYMEKDTWTNTIWFLGVYIALAYGTWYVPESIFFISGIFQFNRIVAMYFIGNCIAILAHLLIESFTTEGIDLFYPLFGYTYTPDGTRKSNGIRIPLYPKDSGNGNFWMMIGVIWLGFEMIVYKKFF